jgi:transposase InsO family protein
VKMNVLYRSLGMSKQSFHQRLNRQLILLEEMEQLLVLVKQVRMDHPRMGYGPQNYIELIQMTTKAVLKYNSERPHQSIGNISPYEFEKILTAA